MQSNYQYWWNAVQHFHDHVKTADIDDEKLLQTQILKAYKSLTVYVFYLMFIL